MNDQQYITGTITDVRNYQQSQAYYQMGSVRPELDLNYLKTLPGMLKCICIVSVFILKKNDVPKRSTFISMKWACLFSHFG